MALIEQEQQPQPQQSKKGFFVIKKKALHNTSMPISYFDDEGHFRGITCFEDYFIALKYMQKYEDKLAQNHLKETKKYDNSRNRHTYNELKLFIENTRPSVYQFR